MSVEDLLKAAGRPLSHFRRLREIRVFVVNDSDGYPDPAVHLTIATEDSSHVALSLRAVGVREFHVAFSGTPIQIMGLAIESLRDRQWERLNWRVFDKEDDKIGFMCRDVELTQCEDPEYSNRET
jgi:hypothetical protein